MVGTRVLVEISRGGYAVEGVAALVLYVPWVTLWIVGTVVLGYGWAWNAFGYEAIAVSGGRLTIRKNVLGYSSVRSFRVSEVEDVRAGGVGDETIEFDVRGETHKLRTGRRKVQEAVTQIKQRLSMDRRRG